MNALPAALPIDWRPDADGATPSATGPDGARSPTDRQKPVLPWPTWIVSPIPGARTGSVAGAVAATVGGDPGLTATVLVGLAMAGVVCAALAVGVLVAVAKAKETVSFEVTLFEFR